MNPVSSMNATNNSCLIGNVENNEITVTKTDTPFDVKNAIPIMYFIYSVFEVLR